MRLRILLAAIVGMLSTTAFAADLLNYKPEPVMAAVPTFDWTGFHAGISGGYGFNADDPSYSFTNVPPGRGSRSYPSRQILMRMGASSAGPRVSTNNSAKWCSALKAIGRGPASVRTRSTMSPATPISASRLLSSGLTMRWIGYPQSEVAWA